MAKLPYMMVYTSDYRRDTRHLSLASKGALWEILLELWDCPTRGSLTLTLDQWARVIGSTPEQAESCLGEIGDPNKPVLDLVRNADGSVTLVSRRMVREERERASTRARVSNYRSKTKGTPVLRECNGDVTLENSEFRVSISSGASARGPETGSGSNAEATDPGAVPEPADQEQGPLPDQSGPTPSPIVEPDADLADPLSIPAARAASNAALSAFSAWAAQARPLGLGRPLSRTLGEDRPVLRVCVQFVEAGPVQVEGQEMPAIQAIAAVARWCVAEQYSFLSANQASALVGRMVQTLLDGGQLRVQPRERGQRRRPATGQQPFFREDN